MALSDGRTRSLSLGKTSEAVAGAGEGHTRRGFFDDRAVGRVAQQTGHADPGLEGHVRSPLVIERGGEGRVLEAAARPISAESAALCLLRRHAEIAALIAAVGPGGGKVAD